MILLLSNLHVGGGSTGDFPGGDQDLHSSFCELHRPHCRDTGVCMCVCVCGGGEEKRRMENIIEDETKHSNV